MKNVAADLAAGKESPRIKISQLAQALFDGRRRDVVPRAVARQTSNCFGVAAPTEFPLFAAYLVRVDSALHAALCFSCCYSRAINSWSCGNE